MAGATYTIGGKAYQLVEAGAAFGLDQDAFVSAQLERAGATDPALKELTGPALVREVYLRVLEHGKVGPVVAGFLVPAGAPWSVDGAHAVARALGAVGSTDERTLLFQILRGVVEGFFGSTRSSDETGPSSSPGGEAGSPASPPSSEVPSISPDGSPSSAPSSGMTPPSADASGDGPSPTFSASISST